MRTIQLTILALLLASFTCSCKKKDIDPDPDPDPNADVVLDELVDKEEYSEGMTVDCRYFKGIRTDRIVINQTEYLVPGTHDLSSAGYYRIEIFAKNNSNNKPDAIRIVILDPVRGQTEWGLPPWTPKGVDIETIGSQQIQTIFPRNIPQGVSFPLIVVVESQLTHSIDNLKGSIGLNSFLIKRGTGSIWVPSGEQSPDHLEIDHRTFPIQTGVFTEAPLSISGVLEDNILIPSESYVIIPSDLTISPGISLTIEEGAFISIDPAVNIINEGSLLIKGSDNNPVTFTCSDNEAYWGGVIGTGSGNRVEASHAIFCRSGYHAGGDYNWGHAHRQALFYSEEGSIVLDHCYMIDHIGQIFYPISATLEIDCCLIQRCMTGGQLNTSRVTINHSVFTDFPDDSKVYKDNDNDALYLIECVALINSSVFMYAKDDGLDSGGSTGGEVTVRNSRFESVFHEGAALSGGYGSEKNQSFFSCIFSDCGQGLELGFGSSDHKVMVDSCIFLNNGIGIRYGDNYNFANDGYISIENSTSKDNVSYDVWNMDRADWVADTSNMDFNNVWVSKGNPMYPQLKILE